MNRYKRVAVAFIAGGGLTVGTLAVTGGTAFADYGPSSAYQVEISANTNHPSTGSFWMWTELTPAASSASYGTGDYQETDCIHQGAGGANAAAHDSGTLNWSIANGVLTLTNVEIIGGAETATMRLPTTSAPGGYGHTNGMTVEVTAAPSPLPPGLPPVGAIFMLPSQNQIAP